MAKTFAIDYPAAEVSTGLQYFVRRRLEAATQTFTRGQFLAWSSGYIAKQADPVASGTAVGFATRAGQNNASAGIVFSEFIQVYPGFLFFANFLTAAGATTNLAATDFGTQTDIPDDAVHADGSSVVTYVSDETSDVTAEMISGKNDQQIANSSESKALAGDTDARCLFALLGDAVSFAS